MTEPKLSDPLCLACIEYIYGALYRRAVSEKMEACGLDTCTRCEKTRVVYKLPMDNTKRKRCPHCKGALD